MNAEITAIGSVSPVMIVLRQLCRNRKTIAIVSSAPSISVRLHAAERIARPSRCRRRRGAARRRAAASCAAPRRRALIASPVSTMLASCCLKTWNEIDGTPSTREIESGSRSRSTSVAEVGEADHQAVAVGDDHVGERLRRRLHLALDAHDRVFLGCR